jgi:uncharacterized glyoxalase superfamily protein PhnB
METIMINPMLNVHSVAASLTFYTQTVGLFKHEGAPLTAADGTPVFAGVMFGATMLMFNGDPTPSDVPRGHGVELHIQIPAEQDIDALYARLQAAHVPVVMAIRDEFWGERRFVVADPDGYHLSIAKQTRDVSFDEMQAVTSQG